MCCLSSNAVALKIISTPPKTNIKNLTCVEMNKGSKLQMYVSDSDRDGNCTSYFGVQVSGRMQEFKFFRTFGRVAEKECV